MSQAASGRDGLIVAPDAAAAEAGAAVLREGGSAVEALVAASAVCAVTQPDHCGLGGDGVWLLEETGDAAPVVIESFGRAAAALPALDAIPTQGPLSVLTPPGAVASWQAALDAMPGALPVSRLLAPAVAAAEGPLAATLERLAAAGLRDVYSGDVAAALAADLAAAGSPVTAGDLAAHEALRREPLLVRLRSGTAYAPPPPSQGVAVLMMLGLLDRLELGAEPGGFDHLHAVIEAAKQTLLVRDPAIAEPEAMTLDVGQILTPRFLAERASDIVPNLALQWPLPALDGDTVFLACADRAGRAACTLQSLGAVGGSGVRSAQTGITLHNRGAAFSPDPASPRALAPGRRPFHTLAPLLARLKDGRRLMMGTPGADAQPQVLAQLYSRLVGFRHSPAEALAAPRVRLSDAVEAEAAHDPRVLEGLRAAGHAVRETALTGGAGLLALLPEGAAGAVDPREAGVVLAV